jgi:hypothetical protein
MGVEKFPDSLLRIAHGAHCACSCSPDAAVGSGNPGAAGIAAAHISMRQYRPLLYLDKGAADEKQPGIRDFRQTPPARAASRSIFDPSRVGAIVFQNGIMESIESISLPAANRYGSTSGRSGWRR